MKRTIAVLALAGSMIALALAVHADAPPDQYAIFQAQTPTITDSYAKLEWERFPEDNRLAGDAGADGGTWAAYQTFSNARTRCGNLGNGWRLPTVKELLTIVDEDPHKIYVDGSTPFLYVDRNAFPTAFPEPYWTSSAQAGTLAAWTVDFLDGKPKADSPSSVHRSRCVRVAP